MANAVAKRSNVSRQLAPAATGKINIALGETKS